MKLFISENMIDDNMRHILKVFIFEQNKELLFLKNCKLC